MVVDGIGDWGWKMVVVEVAVRIGGVAWGSVGGGRLGLMKKKIVKKNVAKVQKLMKRCHF